ncbi:MAG: spermidine/putrescine transporter ATPase subunit [Chloroflexi bacterium]|nr:spermidine/putrescine transporter ATPase subunit [Chloroflexota bacterium]
MMTETSGIAIELKNVVKRFPNPGGGEVVAVDHVNLKIRNGEFFSLLGPSGCGKTTSLRMVAGFEWPTEGEIFLNGKAIGRTPPFLRQVNTVFQNYALFQHMTVFQNVAFGLEMEKATKSEIDRRVNAALEMVQLGKLGNRKPRQLSGGQQQRVALARALVKRPAVLLLDEPLGALDMKLRKEMQLELKALQEQVGITFIYVTHDQEEALTMSDRIAVMDRGKALQVGSPVEIYERPNCRFVADFIGETNFISGVVTDISEGLATVRLDFTDREMVGLPQGDVRRGQKVSISVRPEKLRLVQEMAYNIGQVPNSLNSFPVKVITTTYIGSDTRVLVEMNEHIHLRVWEQNRISTLDPQAYYMEGQQVWVTALNENVLVLPEEEG